MRARITKEPDFARDSVGRLVLRLALPAVVARISIFLACLRKVILLIPLCFLLPLAMGVDGVFYSEGIADIAAGVTTALTFFIMFPRILKKREAALAAENCARHENADVRESEQEGANAVS